MVLVVYCLMVRGYCRNIQQCRLHKVTAVIYTVVRYVLLWDIYCCEIIVNLLVKIQKTQHKTHGTCTKTINVILICTLSSQLQEMFSSCLSTKSSEAHIVCLMHATCLTHFIFLDMNANAHYDVPQHAITNNNQLSGRPQSLPAPLKHYLVAW
jgi:hypothetical protein